MDIEELIRGYFNKELNAEEEAVYQKRYENDASFRELADQMEIEILAARNVGRTKLKQKFSQWEEETENVPEQNAGNQIFFARAWKVGIAAMFVIAFGLYFFFPPPQEDFFLSYYAPYENFEHVPVRDETAGVETSKDQAYAFYDSGEFIAAEKSFSKLLEIDPSDVPARFFRGICSIESSNYENAIVDFDWVANGNVPHYSDAAKWYGALIYIKLKKEQQGIELLQELSSKTGDYQDKARELLEKL